MHRGDRLVSSLGALATMLLWPTIGVAQTDPFGIQFRANAAEQMIVLGVQQGISSLPPTSGQSFTYRFNETLGAFEPNERLEPFSFRSPQTVGKGRFSGRLALSYFNLSNTKLPIDYCSSGKATPVCNRTVVDPDEQYSRFGLEASAHVGLVNMGANYGILEWLEVNLNLPLVVTSAQAKQIYYDNLGTPAQQPSFTPQYQRLDDPMLFEKRQNHFESLGAEFSDGTNFGVGRISLGTKARILSRSWLELAFFPEFFFPSPNEDELAGSDTAAILPRVVASVPALDVVKFFADVGYDYDFDEEPLRRFVWNVGAAVPLSGLTLDFGVGGSEFAEGIQWTPDSATGGGLTVLALDRGATRLGTSFVDFLGGFKVRLAKNAVLGGGVNIPLTDEGFRADAVGTLSVELYF